MFRTVLVHHQYVNWCCIKQTKQYFNLLRMWKNWWHSSLQTEYVWRAELKQRVDILEVFVVSLVQS
jgi:hypothetical protein